jgi:hypothetical protein
MKISFLFAWYDLFFGFYWDRAHKWLYVVIFPTIGFIIKFRWVEVRTPMFEHEGQAYTVGIPERIEKGWLATKHNTI